MAWFGELNLCAVATPLAPRSFHGPAMRAFGDVMGDVTKTELLELQAALESEVQAIGDEVDDVELGRAIGLASLGVAFMAYRTPSIEVVQRVNADARQAALAAAERRWSSTGRERPGR